MLMENGIQDELILMPKILKTMHSVLITFSVDFLNNVIYLALKNFLP